MKNKIFLYLFVFSALIALYLFVSSGNMSKENNTKIASLEKETVKLKTLLKTSRILENARNGVFFIR